MQTIKSKHQATASKVNCTKSVEQCLSELGLTREELKFLLFQAARFLRQNPVPDKNGKIDCEHNFVLSLGAYSLCWMLESGDDADDAMECGLALMEMDTAKEETEVGR